MRGGLKDRWDGESRHRVNSAIGGGGGGGTLHTVLGRGENSKKETDKAVVLV